MLLFACLLLGVSFSASLVCPFLSVSQIYKTQYSYMNKYNFNTFLMPYTNVSMITYLSNLFYLKLSQLSPACSPIFPYSLCY